MPDKDIEERLLMRAKQSISQMLADKGGHRDLSMTEMEDLWAI